VWRWTGDNRFRDEMYDFAKRNLQLRRRTLDDDRDGWPEGSATSSATGMGRRSSTTPSTSSAGSTTSPTWRARRRRRARSWARTGRRAAQRFDGTWWIGRDAAYADSLSETTQQIEQKHWITVTPMEAELTVNGRAVPGLAHVDTGPALAPTRPVLQRRAAAQPRAVPHRLRRRPDGTGRRTIFSLNTAIQAVGEGNYGRSGRASSSATPTRTRADVRRARRSGEPDEQPARCRRSCRRRPVGKNIDRCWTCRSMFMQAWGHYGTVCRW
jgi:hypothetical protein